MAPLNNTNIIDTKDEGIVVKETLISISGVFPKFCVKSRQL